MDLELDESSGVELQALEVRSFSFLPPPSPLSLVSPSPSSPSPSPSLSLIIMQGGQSTDFFHFDLDMAVYYAARAN